MIRYYRKEKEIKTTDLTIDQLPSGVDSIRVSTKIHPQTLRMFQNMTATVAMIDDAIVKALDGTTDSEIFREYMRELHNVPRVWEDDELARKLNVVGYSFRRNPQGYRQLVGVEFEDGTTWRRG